MLKYVKRKPSPKPRAIEAESGKEHQMRGIKSTAEAPKISAAALVERVEGGPKENAGNRY